MEKRVFNICGLTAFWFLVGMCIYLLLRFDPAYGQGVSIRPDATQATNVSVTCGATATVLLAANAKRRALIIIAPTGNTAAVYFGFSTALTTANGFGLLAGNGFTDDTYIGALYCIVGSGTQPLIVGQITR